MGRIRSIKPEFPQSETTGKLSRDARLLFIQLWTIVDDEGRTRAASRMLASLLYPYDDDARDLIEGWLIELEDNECIIRYEIDGSSYLEVCNWLKHQKIDHPSKSKIAAPTESLAKPREASRNLAPDLGPRTKDQDLSTSLRSVDAPEAPKKPNPKSAGLRHRSADGVLQILEAVLSPDIAAGVIEHRRKLRKPLTALAAEGLAKAFAATGAPDEAARTMIERGWQGFRGDWFERDRNSAPASNTSAPGPTEETFELGVKGRKVTAANLRKHVERWEKSGEWLVSECPPPGQPGCLVPIDLLPARYRQARARDDPRESSQREFSDLATE